MERPRREKFALVLQGGGALGSYQAGAYQALQQNALSFDWVAGVSIGAINGALICGNPPELRVERLRRFWNQTSSNLLGRPLAEDETSRRLFNEASAAMTAAFGVPGFFAPRSPPLLPGWPGKPSELGLYDAGSLRETLNSLVDFDLLNAGAMRYSIGAVNIQTGNFQYFDTARHRIGPEHVMASAALPPGFSPVEIAGEYYWDGGIVSNTPLQYVLDLEEDGDDYCVFQLDLFSARGELPRTLLEAAQREKDIRYSSRTRFNTDALCERRRLRAMIRKVCAKLPVELRDDADWRALSETGGESATTIVHLIHRRAAYESASRDYEFSRLTMEENWSDGRTDVEKTLNHPAWIHRRRPAGGVQVFDLTRVA
ncbi:patatin-like phospholipase family protein [Methylocystis heyeri]|uniref:Patatin-like phospholipase family protein n=1 Tax=Methylocystis heyeri TaxID=391905 RepID=A0A6B8KJ38_9HYPH|nr:patatin-like phospholipase family protein [Methylocystis heyeri]QGM47519.1 patatin-like phospholipase family protein [Methylocystis heyeri]